MQGIEVTGLVVYPVKSLKGIPVTSAVLTAQGLEHDRRFMVVRADGRFVTQRDMPGLARVETRLDPDGLILSMPGAGAIRVPFGVTDGDRIETRVWDDVCETVDQGEVVSKWLTSALASSESLRLVCMAPGFIRPQARADLLGRDTHTLFADAAPFLVANEASLEALNSELLARGESAVPMNRFRPNIVLRGLAPFAEHQIAGIASANYALKFTHPCQRCVVTTIDQATAEKDSGWQPYKTLREINPMPDNERAPAFAHNATLSKGAGVKIALEDRVSAEGSSK